MMDRNKVKALRRFLADEFDIFDGTIQQSISQNDSLYEVSTDNDFLTFLVYTDEEAEKAFIYEALDDIATNGIGEVIGTDEELIQIINNCLKDSYIRNFTDYYENGQQGTIMDSLIRKYGDDIGDILDSIEKNDGLDYDNPKLWEIIKEGYGGRGYYLSGDDDKTEYKFGNYFIYR